MPQPSHVLWFLLAVANEPPAEAGPPTDLEAVRVVVPEATRLWSGFEDQRPMGRHNAIDIKAKTGAHILAPLSGQVTGRGTHPTAGHWMELAHEDGTVTRYLHLSRFDKKIGDPVEIGDRIGRVGATGNARKPGPHLHFEWLVDRRPRDPMPHLRGIVNQLQAPAAPLPEADPKDAGAPDGEDSHVVEDGG